MSAPRLDKATKDKIVAAYVAGEKVADIAKRFGVDPTYPGLLARRRGHSMRWQDALAEANHREVPS